MRLRLELVRAGSKFFVYMFVGIVRLRRAASSLPIGIEITKSTFNSLRTTAPANQFLYQTSVRKLQSLAPCFPPGLARSENCYTGQRDYLPHPCTEFTTKVLEKYQSVQYSTTVAWLPSLAPESDHITRCRATYCM